MVAKAIRGIKAASAVSVCALAASGGGGIGVCYLQRLPGEQCQERVRQRVAVPQTDAHQSELPPGAMDDGMLQVGMGADEKRCAAVERSFHQRDESVAGDFHWGDLVNHRQRPGAEGALNRAQPDRLEILEVNAVVPHARSLGLMQVSEHPFLAGGDIDDREADAMPTSTDLPGDHPARHVWKGVEHALDQRGLPDAWPSGQRYSALDVHELPFYPRYRG